MAWFDWIGETIGGAAHAFAEFIADGFQGVLDGVGSAISGISKDFMSGIVTMAQNPNDPLHQGAKTLYDKSTEPITKGFDHTVAGLAAGHSEISPSAAAAEVQAIYDKVRIDAGAATTTAIAIEAASIGQIESPMTAFQIADKISGATNFAGTVAAMKYKSLWLTPYEYHLNAISPNMRPGPTDLIRFAFREVWDPTRRQELLEEGYPGEFATQMLFQGYNQSWTESYWAAHWTLPSVGELNEMLHRGAIDEATWDRFVKYNDFDPKVRPWLKAISYNPYTRVDSQRMWSLDLLTEQELKDNYKALGYDENHAQRMTLWTKINVLATELRARYSKGWITAAQVKAELISEGMPAAKVEIWVQRIVKAEAAARTDTEKDLTKSEIIKGYTKETIDYPTALAMLIDMGYDSDEAEYILIVNTAVAKTAAVPEPKRLTKAEIIKGYKLNIITYDYALQGLIGLNYSEDDASYLLAIGAPEATAEEAE